jgi:hypothetical protein
MRPEGVYFALVRTNINHFDKRVNGAGTAAKGWMFSDKLWTKLSVGMPWNRKKNDQFR